MDATISYQSLNPITHADPDIVLLLKLVGGRSNSARVLRSRSRCAWAASLDHLAGATLFDGLEIAARDPWCVAP